jgi:hypothetical protein
MSNTFLTRSFFRIQDGVNASCSFGSWFVEHTIEPCNWVMWPLGDPSLDFVEKIWCSQQTT